MSAELAWVAIARFEGWRRQDGSLWEYVVVRTACSLLLPPANFVAKRQSDAAAPRGTIGLRYAVHITGRTVKQVDVEIQFIGDKTKHCICYNYGSKRYRIRGLQFRDIKPYARYSLIPTDIRMQVVQQDYFSHMGKLAVPHRNEDTDGFLKQSAGELTKHALIGGRYRHAAVFG